MNKYILVYIFVLLFFARAQAGICDLTQQDLIKISQLPLSLENPLKVSKSQIEQIEKSGAGSAAKQAWTWIESPAVVKAYFVLAVGGVVTRAKTEGGLDYEFGLYSVPLKKQDPLTLSYNELIFYKVAGDESGATGVSVYSNDGVPQVFRIKKEAQSELYLVDKACRIVLINQVKWIDGKKMPLRELQVHPEICLDEKVNKAISKIPKSNRSLSEACIFIGGQIKAKKDSESGICSCAKTTDSQSSESSDVGVLPFFGDSCGTAVLPEAEVRSRLLEMDSHSLSPRAQDGKVRPVESGDLENLKRYCESFALPSQTPAKAGRPLQNKKSTRQGK